MKPASPEAACCNSLSRSYVKKNHNEELGMFVASFYLPIKLLGFYGRNVSANCVMYYSGDGVQCLWRLSLAWTEPLWFEYSVGKPILNDSFNGNLVLACLLAKDSNCLYLASQATLR